MKNVRANLVAFFAVVASVFHLQAREAQACGQMVCGPSVQIGIQIRTQVASMPLPTPIPQPMPQPIAVGGCQFAGGCGFPAYGANFRMGGHGFASGAFGAIRPAWFGPIGRFPKLFFRAPLRRGLGLPGFTPVRQFAFGRGAIRRQNRRAFLFGRCFSC
jgi:hypothetical protein